LEKWRTPPFCILKRKGYVSRLRTQGRKGELNRGRKNFFLKGRHLLDHRTKRKYFQRRKSRAQEDKASPSESVEKEGRSQLGGRESFPKNIGEMTGGAKPVSEGARTVTGSAGGYKRRPC